MNFTVSPKQITRLLIFITLGLAFFSLAGQFYIYFLNGEKLLGLVHMFNLDAERNIPTLFSGLLLLFCSILLEFVALAKQRNQNHDVYYWHGLSIMFMYLSFDELLLIHESINSILRKITQSESGAKWDILNVILVSIFSLVYLRFLLKLPKKINQLFLLGFICFVVGAVGIELIGVHFLTGIYHQKIFLEEVITTIEECLEILGLAFFIHGILLYISSLETNIRINFVGSESFH